MAGKYIYNKPRVCKNCHKDFMGAYKNATYCSVSCMRDSYQSKPQKEFHQKYKIDDVTGCWNWTGSICQKGYGRIKHKKKAIKAHRLSFEIHFHAIDNSELFVCHKCDNRRCVNPEHLFLGTCKDNIEDMYKKGRNSPRHGENSGTAKLTEDIVKGILVDERTHKQIAIELGVTRECISRIKQRKSWKHV